MTQRSAQLGAMARYSARQVVMSLKGGSSTLSQLRDLAWFESSAKKLPTTTLEDMYSGITDLPIRLERGLSKIRGNVTIDELAVIALLCQRLKPKVIFEFGTFNGRTTLNLAANAPPDAKVYTLDLSPDDETHLATDQEDGVYHLGKEAGTFFRDSPFRDRIEQLWCDSARFDETSFRGRVDLVFVDGSHSYEYVRSDSSKALAMIRPEGIVLWHDYCAWYPGVFRWLHELLPSHRLKHIEGTHLAILCAK